MTAMLTGAEPQLFVADIEASCRFFVDKLGFEVVFTYGTPPYYGQVRRDAARLNLRRVDAPVMDPARRDSEEWLAATITDAAALFASVEAAGGEFARRLGTEPWGARTFIVRDPDGNLIYFAGPGH